jgi:hypothetical protein
LGVFKFFVWSFTSEEVGYVHFFMWTLKVFCLCIFFNFFLVILGVFNFFMWSFKGGDRVFDFLLKTLKVFYFGILKFQSFQFPSCHFGDLKKFRVKIL